MICNGNKIYSYKNEDDTVVTKHKGTQTRPKLQDINIFKEALLNQGTIMSYNKGLKMDRGQMKTYKTHKVVTHPFSNSKRPFIPYCPTGMFF
jgi:hypothetical protein